MCLIAGAEPVSGGKLCLGIDLQHMLKMLAQEGTCAGIGKTCRGKAQAQAV